MNANNNKPFIEAWQSSRRQTGVWFTNQILKRSDQILKFNSPKKVKWKLNFPEKVSADLNIEIRILILCAVFMNSTCLREKCAFLFWNLMSLCRLWMNKFRMLGRVQKWCYDGRVWTSWNRLFDSMKLESHWDQVNSSLRPNIWSSPNQSKIHKILDAVAPILDFLCTWWWFYTQFWIFSPFPLIISWL